MYNKSSFKVENRPVPQEYNNKIFYDNVQCKKQWINFCSLPQMQSLMEKGYAVCKVRSLHYYSFRVLSHHNQILNVGLYSKQRQCVHENVLRKCPTLVNRRNVLL